MTLKQKREIVARFKAGEFVLVLALVFDKPYDLLEAVLRDYMNGKFSLKPERKRKWKKP